MGAVRRRSALAGTKGFRLLTIALALVSTPIENKAVRLPFRVQCRACGWSTDAVKLEAVAVKLWNGSKARGQGQSAPEMKSPQTRQGARNSG
jgi:hypothetical protein